MGLPNRERTELEWLLRRDRSIVNGSDPNKWNWPSPPSEQQLAEARAFVVTEGEHEVTGFVVVLDGSSSIPGTVNGGDVWLYGSSSIPGTVNGGVVRLYGSSSIPGTVSGGVRIDSDGNVDGDESQLRPREEEIAMLDRIRGIVLADPDRLDMNEWHGEEWTPDCPIDGEVTCGTTHCLAGWAQALTTDPTLRTMPAQIAGKNLLPRSGHLFFANEERVLQYLRDREYATEAAT